MMIILGQLSLVKLALEPANIVGISIIIISIFIIEMMKTKSIDMLLKGAYFY